MNSTAAEKTVIIAGASGLVGTAAANAFAAAGWQVVALSRRKPELVDHPACTHISVDLTDATQCRKVAAQIPGVTHLVYAAVFELPGLIAGWSDPEQIATNDQMLNNLLTPLLAQTDLKHITLLQGTKAYGGSVQPMRIPAREDQARVEHANFYWLQEDRVTALADRGEITYTILRPQLIVGPNHGVVMNLPPVVGAYAAIRHAEGKSCGFPGGPEWVWEAVDVRLVGNACVWAATADTARNETFNMTNGEVFSWRDMWGAITRTLGVDQGPDEPVSLAQYLEQRGHIWRVVVQRHRLQPIALPDLLGESHHYADLCFAYGAQTPPPPTFVSTIKIKQAGFTETANSADSFCFWLRDLQRRRILPTL